MRLLALALCAMLAGGCVSSFKDDELAAKFAKPVLRVGLNPDFPPLIFSQNGKICGMEAQFAERIADMLGAKLVFVEKPWEELIPSLEKGEFDVIMSGMTDTPERAKTVRFTRSYVRVGQMALMRTADIAVFSTPEKVISTDRTIGFIGGTTGEAFTREKCLAARKVAFQRIEDAQDALLNGKIDLFITDGPAIWDISDTSLTLLCVPLTEEHLAWAVRRDDSALAGILDECLAKMAGNGYLEEVRSNWIPELIRKNIR